MKKKFIVLTHGWESTPWYGMSIAYRLQKEGYEVFVGYNDEDIEDKDEKKLKVSQFDGMLNKMPIAELFDKMDKEPNKDEYFVFCDHSELFEWSEKFLAAGFEHGLFPTEQDYDFEKDRELAMEFVKEHYQGIKLIPFNEFSTVEEAKAFIESTPDVYVLQSKGDFCSTVVPTSDNPELASMQIINQMEKNQSEYEKGGLILKKKLINPVEVTPQIVFYNGEPVFTDLDIETKNIGDGINNGEQVGCGTNLIIKTDIEAAINKLAFPEIVYEMANQHTGMFVWDISLYFTDSGIYFGEFCANRLGFDAAMTEMCMSEGAGEYFESIMARKNPLKREFGTSLRLFNLCKGKDINVFMEDIEDYIWFFDVKMSDSDIVTAGACWDLGVLTAAGDTIEYAVDKLFSYRDKFVFKEMYSRTKRDFMDVYPTSIIQRFEHINGRYIDATKLVKTQ